MEFHNFFYLIIIVLTIIGIALGRIPGFRMNRATIALVGAACLILLNADELAAVIREAIDIDTIVLLFAMMVININLRLAGFFRIIANFTIKIARTPKQLLGFLIFFSGFLSALFLNDTIVLMFTPLILDILLIVKRNPIPYLIALATSANIGSAATIIGNPQNMIIGMASNMSFLHFSARLAPLAFINLFFVWIVIVLLYKNEFRDESFTINNPEKVYYFKPLLIKSLAAISLMIIALAIGFSISLSALIAAAILLFTRRIKPERVFRELDWSLLVFFSALFVVTHAFYHHPWGNIFFRQQSQIALQSVAHITFFSAILSNLISNVPAVMLFTAPVKSLQNPETAWLVLAMATTFAGNLTLLGSVANMIVAETAKKRGVHLSFGEYLKTGAPITVISLLSCVLWFS